MNNRADEIRAIIAATFDGMTREQKKARLREEIASIDVILEAQRRIDEMWEDHKRRFGIPADYDNYLWFSPMAQESIEPVQQEKTAPRRRVRIFEKSGGMCHYCGVLLDLHGRWHIEHKMPRSLMGGSEEHNLVAACVTCNMRKKDKTDLEFQAQLDREAA